MTNSTIPGADAATDERALFEAWARKECNMPPDVAMNWNALWVKAALQSFQAGRASLSTPAVVKGCLTTDAATIKPNLIVAGSRVEQDAARLEFLMEREAWIAWSKDGESCRLFHRGDDGESMPMLGWGARHWSHDPREAIDAAIKSLTTPKEG